MATRPVVHQWRQVMLKEEPGAPRTPFSEELTDT